MAFNNKFLFLGRNVYNACAFLNGLALHSYSSATDNVSAILLPGYFPSYFGTDPNQENVAVNDVLFIKGADSDSLMIIDNLNPVSLSLFETRGLSSLNIVIQEYLLNAFGIWSSPTSINIDDTTTGNVSTLSLDTSPATSNGGTTITFTAVTPSLDASVQPLIVINNGVFEIGKLQMSGTTVQITRLNGAAFTNGASAGISDTVFLYKNNLTAPF